MPQRPPQQTLAMECCVAGAFRILSLVKTLDTDVKVLLSSQAGNQETLEHQYLVGLYYFIIKNEKCNSNTKIPPELTGFNCLKYKDYREFSTLMPGPMVVAIVTLLT